MDKIGAYLSKAKELLVLFDRYTLECVHWDQNAKANRPTKLASTKDIEALSLDPHRTHNCFKYKPRGLCYASGRKTFMDDSTHKVHDGIFLKD